MTGKPDVTAPARLLAVEVLLAEPELLGNDALEADLYVLRDDLRTSLRAENGRQSARPARRTRADRGNGRDCQSGSRTPPR